MDSFHFPTLNASLNGLSGVLLVLGYLAVKVRRLRLHTICMLSAVVVSALFLSCYLYFHLVVQKGQPTYFSARNPEAPSWAATLYLLILGSHTLLAALVKLFIAGRVLQVSWRQMGTALRPSLLAGAGMALAVLAALYLAAGLPPWLQLAIGVAVGALAYLAIVSRLEPGLTAAALARVRDLRRRPLTPEVSEA